VEPVALFDAAPMVNIAGAALAAVLLMTGNLQKRRAQA
jgi:hypothetical protein